MLKDRRTAPVEARVQAALELIEQLVTRPLELNPAQLQRATERGLSEEALRALGASVFHFQLMNRLADAFDFQLPTAEQHARMAPVLNMMTRRIPLGPTGEAPVLGEDGRLRPREVQRGLAQLTSSPGRTEPQLRQRVMAYMRASLKVPQSAQVELPQSLARYLEKLCHHAYRILDEDLEALREHGWNDEAILELTLAGAVTVASVGLESLLGGLAAGASPRSYGSSLKVEHRNATE